MINFCLKIMNIVTKKVRIIIHNIRANKTKVMNKKIMIINIMKMTVMKIYNITNKNKKKK
jgi:hypothetical protein